MDTIRTKLTEEIYFEVCPDGDSGNGTQWDILIESAARRRAAIEARGIPNCGRSEMGGGRNWAVKTNRLVLWFVVRVTSKSTP